MSIVDTGNLTPFLFLAPEGNTRFIQEVRLVDIGIALINQTVWCLLWTERKHSLLAGAIGTVMRVCWFRFQSRHFEKLPQHLEAIVE